ncbi:SPOR domain-containing protein [Sphingorhabdus sp. EL138]|uniref:SPOR domain-containing protein n=1 Tax=Sphingorhabdus sp. EL138 TaxID=2073156 RepID=UPI0025CC3C54|nr:SPOR domain-containing protein [Sphingorhabdus sp. EL138]
MINRNNDGLNLDDNDRLPWLETADGYAAEPNGSPMRLAYLGVAGFALLAAIVGGIYWLQSGQAGGPNGTGELIVAPKSNYKEKPADAGGKSFEGEGDSAFAASEGQKTGAVLAVPPAGPVTAQPATPTATDKAPANAVLVQLGAFGDFAKAETAWTGLNKRFGFLAGMNRKIAQANVEGGGTVFRLQAVTANSTEAQQLCAKLRVAGENCLIVR